MSEILGYIVAATIILGLGPGFMRLFKVKVWIWCKIKKKPMIKIGFMDRIDEFEAPEVHLSGLRIGPPLGRVIIPDNSDNASVELQTENVDSDSCKSEFRSYGYITPEGMIYSKVGNKRPQYIGYTARPSAPDSPTIYGERSWRNFWMKCTLDVYTGSCQAQDDDSSDDSSAVNQETEKEKQTRVQKNSKKKKLPLAICSFTGFHNSKHDVMPTEARACAFAAIYSRHARKEYREYYNNQAYGWKDTALLSATIYIIAYLMLYLIRVQILGKAMIGFNLKNNALFCAMFFAIWALVRAIKIECIERSNTIQPRIDLFNKSLGQRIYDSLIIFSCLIIISLSGTYYSLDFVPIAGVTIFAIATNMRLRQSNLRWKIEDAFNTSADEDEDSESYELENPKGDISINYEWVLDAPSKSGIKGEAVLYFDSQYISDLRHINPFFSQRNDRPLRALISEMFLYMTEHRSVAAHCKYLSQRIEKIASENDLTEDETLQFILDFVQEPNIVFCRNVNSKAINRLESYVRFPDEVLFDKEADATSKVLLAASLFHFMHRKSLFLYSSKLNHAAIAIEINEDWIVDGTIFGTPAEEVTIKHKGVSYIFCETTGDGLRLGGTFEGMLPTDFEERIELPSPQYEDDDDSTTRLYKWTLDSLHGASLDGVYTLEFSNSEIEELRNRNPFLTYGKDSDTYDDKIRQMFDYIHTDASHTAKVREIAEYIKTQIESAGLPEIDLVQFALDFCQMPNINYKIDEESAGIKYAKEYMRYPDEVLFDKEGDCDCKSSLTAALFHELKYNVVILLSQKLAHAGIGIEYNPSWEQYLPAEKLADVLREYNGRRYLYCETTGDGYKIGAIQESTSIHDFETIVEILV